MSYSREMTHTDYSSMKMGDPYSIFMVDQTHQCYLRNRNVSLFRTGFMDIVSFFRRAVSRFWQMPDWIRRRVNCSLRFVSLKAEPTLATPQNTLAITQNTATSHWWVVHYSNFLNAREIDLNMILNISQVFPKPIILSTLIFQLICCTNVRAWAAEYCASCRWLRNLTGRPLNKELQ